MNLRVAIFNLLNIQRLACLKLAKRSPRTVGYPNDRELSNVQGQKKFDVSDIATKEIQKSLSCDLI